MKLRAITLDCPDPLALAAFYQQATGLEPHPKSDADFAALTCENGLTIGFQRVDDHRAPRWPDQSVPQQLHLDFAVDDLDEAEARLAGTGRGQTGSPAERGQMAGPDRPGRPPLLRDQRLIPSSSIHWLVLGPVVMRPTTPGSTTRQ